MTRKKKRANKASKKGKKAQGIPKQLLELAAIIALLSIFVYAPTFPAEITNWDDETYLLKTPFIKELNGENFKEIWTTRIKSNYHPLTMLSYAVEYGIAGKASPGLIHGTNLLFHILSSILLLYFIFLLSGRWEIAGITAAIFALHPMHVESVAWLSERKDVLYAFFYIAGLICYLKSIRQPQEKTKWLGYTGLLFLASCLSKGMAVSFPLVLVLIDFLERRIFSYGKQLGAGGRTGGSTTTTIFLEKIPFFALALIFGIVAVGAQEDTGAIGMEASDDFGLFDRFFVASYGFCTYLWKLIVPVNLSAVYVYPEKQDGMMPAIFYASMIPALALVSFTLSNFKKYRHLAFGLGFFVVTILMVLQLMPVGRAILAERYTYIPYIGLAFFIGHGFIYLTEKKPQLKPVFTGILLIWLASITFLAHERSKVWLNNETLWTDVIEKQPRAVLAFHNLSYHYKNTGQEDKAVPLYDQGLAIDPNYLGLLVNRGSHNYKQKKYDIAMKDFTAALEIDPNHMEALLNRGAVYHTQGQTEKAMADYNLVLKIKPTEEKVLLNRGMLYSKLGQLDQAILDLNSCVKVAPNYGIAYFQRSKVYYKQGNIPKAKEDANKAITLKYDVPKDYLQKIK